MTLEEFAELKIKSFGKGNVIIKNDKILVSHIGRYLPNLYFVHDNDNITDDSLFYANCKNELGFSFLVGTFEIDENRKKYFRPLPIKDKDNYEYKDKVVLVKITNEKFINGDIINRDDILYKKICMKKEKIKVCWIIVTYIGFYFILHNLDECTKNKLGIMRREDNDELCRH